MVDRFEEAHQAIRDGDVPRLEQLLAAHPELVSAVDELGDGLIHYACLHRVFAALSALLVRGRI